jgi:hypothetical protein
MQPAMPALPHGHAALPGSRRLAWLALGLAAATLTVIQVSGHGGLGFGLRTPAGFQRG